MAHDIPQTMNESSMLAEPNIKVMGSERCDNAAMNEALRVIGLDPHDKPMDGVSEHFETFNKLLPQLRATGPMALKGRDARLDQPDKTGKADGIISDVELAAALIAASQAVVKHGGELKDVPVQEIIDGMCEPLSKLRQEAAPVCRTKPGRTI